MYFVDVIFCIRYEFKYVSFKWISSFHRTISWKNYSFSIKWTWNSCRKSTENNYEGLFLDSQFIYLYVYPHTSTTMSFNYWRFVEVSKFRSVSPPTLFFFKFFWLFWIPCILHEFQDWLANFCNKGSWDSDRGCLEPADQLSEHWNFMDIKLSDYEYGMLFYLLGFLWFLSMMFVTFTVQVLTSFVKLIPSNLILFDSTVNGIFLISFLRIFYYITLHQVIRKSFCSFFPTWWLFPPYLTVQLMLTCKILCISSLKMPFHTNRYCRILVLINRHGFNGNYLLLRRHL